MGRQEQKTRPQHARRMSSSSSLSSSPQGGRLLTVSRLIHSILSFPEILRVGADWTGCAECGGA